MPTARKRFDSPFIVEKSKLKRLIEVIEAKFKENGRTPQFSFEAHLLGQKVIETTSVDEVLALDNSKRNRIERLLVACTAAEADAQTIDRGLTIEFDGRPPATIAIVARGDNAAWAGETFRTAEEQVERTLERSTMNLLSHSRLSMFYLPTAALAVLAALLFVTMTSNLVPSRLTNAMWLTDQDLKALEPLQSDPALAREKAGEILSRQIRNVAHARQQRNSIIAWATQWRSILVIPPALLILAAFAYLYLRCYPNAVFLWGDAEDWYRSLQQRRRFIWSAIIAAFTIGVLADLFVFALATRS